MATNRKAKTDSNAIDEARRRLRDAGLRATPARIAVLNRLAEQSQPSTHQEVYERLAESGLDKSTVFRTLNDLSGAGLARRMELGDHVWRYEAIGESHRSHAAGQVHPHLLCVDCGSVTCLTDNEVALKVSKSLGQIEDVLLKGHCAACHDGESR